MKAWLIAGAACIALGSVSVRARAQHMNAPDAPCRDVGPGVEFSNCLFTAARQKDKELEATYREITRVMRGEELRQFEGSQRLWLAYRKAACDAEGDEYIGGSAHGSAHSACLEALTRERIKVMRDGFGWLVEKRKPYP